MNLRRHTQEYANDIRVDSPTIWSNPYPMNLDTTREESCELYDQYFRDKLREDYYFEKEFLWLVDLYRTHGGLRLFCWCAPKKCHAETIKRLVLREAMKG
jgi:hypothetical protein